MLGFVAVRVAREAAALAQLREALAASGQQLVHVSLMTGVEDDRLGRGVEDPVERDRELDRTEIRPQVTAGLSDGTDQEVADLFGELG